MKKLHHIYFNLDRDFYFKENHLAYNWYYQHQNQIPIGLHLTMFYESVKNLGDDDQVKKWVPLIKNLDILGCYG